jgi:hypothetical protein
MGVEITASHILNFALDRLVFSFPPWPFYSRRRVMEQEAVRETEASGNFGV